MRCQSTTYLKRKNCDAGYKDGVHHLHMAEGVQHVQELIALLAAGCCCRTRSLPTAGMCRGRLDIRIIKFIGEASGLCDTDKSGPSNSMNGKEEMILPRC